MTKLTFTAFVASLGVVLTPTQRVIGLVVYDGVQPRDLRGTDREIARRVFGHVDTIPDEARSVFAAVLGARGGKSYVLGALRLLHLALTVLLTTMAPGEVAAALIVAPDLRLARQTLRYALGAAKSSKAIAARVTAETSDSFTIVRDRGREVVIQCLPATRGGSAVRGRSLVGAFLDECAFFRDKEYIINDSEIFAAIAPRILPGGQTILASTPWTETGLLFELFRDNHGQPTTAIAAHASTELLRPDAKTRSVVAAERLRDPDNASREFDALFLTAGSGLLLDSAAIESCVDPDLFVPAQPITRNAAAGADFGFTSDSSACAVVERRDAGFVLLALDELRPKKGAPLVPSAVVRSFADLASSYGVRRIVADHHYLESVREHACDCKIQILTVPEGQNGKVNAYLLLRRLVNEGQLRIPRHHRLIAQLKALTARPLPGGGLQISSPRHASGGHGDLVSALVCALWRAHATKGQSTFSVARHMQQHAAAVAHAQATTWQFDPGPVGVRGFQDSAWHNEELGNFAGQSLSGYLANQIAPRVNQ